MPRNPFLDQVPVQEFPLVSYYLQDKLGTVGGGGSSISASYADTASYTPNAVVTASAANTTITFTKGDGSTFDVTVSQSGSVATASYALYAISSSYSLTASYAMNGGGSTNTGSLLTTASVSNATITFTKGDGSTFPITVNNITSASYAQTASYYGGNVVSASYASSSTSASYALTASYAMNGGSGTTFPYTGSALITGSLGITGSLSVSQSLDTSARILYDTIGVGVVDWGNYFLVDNSGINSLTWGERTLFDASERRSIEWTSRLLIDPSSVSSVDWERRTLKDLTGVTNLNWSTPGKISTPVAISASLGFTGSLFGTASWASNATSASYALTASYALNAAGGSSTQIATGSVTASVSPTQFSVISGSSTEFVVTGTGVTIGNAVTDTHRITGSLTITGSLIMTGSLIVSGSGGAGVFSKGGTVADLLNGISISGSYITWRAPFSCSVVALYGRRSGGTAPQINARRSGSAGYALHTGSNLTLTTADAWVQANSVTNVSYVAGDSLEIVVSGSGNSQVAVQVDYIKV